MILYNNFILYNSIPIYDYNNPVKYIINKLWNKYNNKLKNINTDFNKNIIIKYIFNNNNNLYGISYLNTLNITFNTIDLNTENNITNTNFKYNIKYKTEAIFKYKIYLTSNININYIPNKTIFQYTIYNYYNNKYNINTININIDNFTIYQNNLIFYSDIDFNSNHFIIFNKINKYDIKQSDITLIGYIYTITIEKPLTYNLLCINEINYNNYNLDIYKNIDNTKKFKIISNIKLNFNRSNKFDILLYIFIKLYINTNDNKTNLEFNNNINYMEYNTFIKIDNNIYILNKIDNKYFINEIIIINNYNVQLIYKLNISDLTIIGPNVLYKYKLPIYLKYDPINIDNYTLKFLILLRMNIIYQYHQHVK